MTLVALDIYQNAEDKISEAECRYRLARLFYKKGEYHKTLLHTEQAIALFKDQENTPRVLDCYNLLGMVYQLCKDFGRAQDFFEAYVDGVTKLNDSTRFAYALNNAAVLENTLGDSIKTRNLIEESLKAAETLKDTSVICMVGLNSAGIFLNLGLPLEARRYLDKVAGMMGDNIEYNALYNLYCGISHYHESEYEKAIAHLRKSVEYFSKGEFEHKLGQCWLCLRIFYERLGNTDSAYVCLNRFHELEANTHDNDVFIELFKAQNQIILSNEREKIAEKQLHNGILFFSILTVAVIACAATIIAYKRRKIKYIIEEEKLKSYKDRYEIRELQKYTTNKLIENTVSELEKLSVQTKEAVTRNSLKAICNNLERSHNEDSWSEISNYIPDRESEFLKKLVADFPGLSTNERRLCILLNKNLSTKEISEITKQSPKSINVARTRLRGKLGLSGSEITIQNFLSKYKNLFKFIYN